MIEDSKSKIKTNRPRRSKSQQKRHVADYRKMVAIVRRSIGIAESLHEKATITKSSAHLLIQQLENLNGLLGSPMLLLLGAQTQVATYMKILEIIDNPKLGGDVFDKPKSYAKDSAVIRFAKRTRRTCLKNINRQQIDEGIFDTMFNNESERALLYSAAVYTWTVFESFASDLWVEVLNANAQTLGYPALKTIDRTSTDGLSSRQIDVGLASKYRFDLRHSLGTLLKPEFDFTGIDGILDAYSRAFQREIPMEEQAPKLLRRLEQTRHLIVHSGGRVDDHFRRTTGVRATRGSLIKLSFHTIADWVNAITLGSIRIIEFIEKWEKEQEARKSAKPMPTEGIRTPS